MSSFDLAMGKRTNMAGCQHALNGRYSTSWRDTGRIRETSSCNNTVKMHTRGVKNKAVKTVTRLYREGIAIGMTTP